MGYVRMTSLYPTDTGLSRDTMTNTMHFAYNGDRSTACSAIASEWAGFLAVIDGYMANSIYDPNLAQVFFDMEDPEPRAPVFTSTFGATYPIVASLPLECSMVVSFAGPVVSGAGAGRKRGRIYLPAFDTTTITSGSGLVTWTSSVVNAVGAAFQDFAQDLLALTSPIALQVYSPTADAGGATLAGSMTAVTRMWVDNEPDTQRRRGQGDGTKTSWVI